MNEEKIVSLLVKITTDIADMKTDFGRRFDALEIGQSNLKASQKKLDQNQKSLEQRLDARIDEVIDRLEEIEAKNLTRHSEMLAMIKANKDDITILKKAIGMA